MVKGRYREAECGVAESLEGATWRGCATLVSCEHSLLARELSTRVDALPDS
jgi:hypothetical protein